MGGSDLRPFGAQFHEADQKLVDSVHAEVGSRTIGELEAERDEVLLGLIELRKRSEAVAPRQVAAE